MVKLHVKEENCDSIDCANKDLMVTPLTINSCIDILDICFSFYQAVNKFIFRIRTQKKGNSSKHLCKRKEKYHYTVKKYAFGKLLPHLPTQQVYMLQRALKFPFHKYIAHVFANWKQLCTAFFPPCSLPHQPILRKHFCWLLSQNRKERKE